MSVYEDMQPSEQLVAKYLYQLDLFWHFEAPVFVYDERERPRVWTPDFYIPKLGMYIEVCGTPDFDYSYRQKIYDKNRINVIFLQVYKKQKWRPYLIKRIMEIEENRHSEIMNMIRGVI